MPTRRALLALTAASYSRIYGANGRPGIALVGSGRRGREVMKAFLTSNRCDFAGLCDIYDAQRKTAVDTLGKPAFETAAFEEVLGRREVDGLLIATPDHHHLDMASDALRSGKHVYLEKPCLHRLEDGAGLRRAVALSNGKLLHAGQQQRSGAHYQRAKAELLDTGKLGKILFVRTIWSNFPWQSRRIAPRTQPATLDWARFIGPAPWVDYQWIRYDSWRYFPDYGGGVLADIFTHWADVAQWFMNDANPLNAVASGGAYLFKDDGRANPDTVNAIVQYKDWNLTFESTVGPVRDDRPGLTFLGTEGTLEITRADYVYTPQKGAPQTVKAEGSLEAAHTGNFLDALAGKARQTANVNVAFESCLPQLLARAAYWSGHRARWSSAKGEIAVN